MDHGFIYPIVKFTIKCLSKLNLVELFKWVVGKITSDPDKRRSFKRFAVDVFVVLKWLFVLGLWLFHLNHPVLTFVVWYLIVTNLFTYFYYHVWDDEAFNISALDADRVRRRLVTLLLAFAYSNVCFAYLYRIPYVQHLTWGVGGKAVRAFWFSISSSLAANYGAVSPADDFSNSVVMIQLMITFIFVTLILSKSPS